MSGFFEQTKSKVSLSEGTHATMRPLVSTWEQRKLGELCTFSKGHGYSKADIRDAGTPLILYGRLYTQYESRIEEVDTFTVEQDGSILSRGNEVIVPASGETAEDIAIASSVRRSGIILGGDLNVVTPTGKLDPDYTALAITYSKAHDDLAKRAQGKSVVHVHGNDIAEVEISYPSESEQKRISSVVLNLDSLITLHQRKCQYRGLYEYLSWEQRKLGSIAASFDYGLNAAATEYDGQNKYLRITDIDDTTHEFLKSDLTTPLADLAMSADYLLEEGDLLFARTGASVGKTYLYRQYDGTVYFAGFLIRARIGESADPEFVYQATLTDAYKKYVAITSQRSGQPGVNAQEYADYQLMLPSRTEQQQIGMTLRSLDNLITLHQ